MCKYGCSLGSNSREDQGSTATHMISCMDDEQQQRDVCIIPGMEWKYQWLLWWYCCRHWCGLAPPFLSEDSSIFWLEVSENKRYHFLPSPKHIIFSNPPTAGNMGSEFLCPIHEHQEDGEMSAAVWTAMRICLWYTGSIRTQDTPWPPLALVPGSCTMPSWWQLSSDSLSSWWWYCVPPISV